jgi:hypothetical protein
VNDRLADIEHIDGVLRKNRRDASGQSRLVLT